MKSMVFLWCLILWLPVNPCTAAANPTLDDIIADVQKNLERPPVAMEVETTTYGLDPNGILPPRVLQMEKANYRKDGPRVDIATERYAPDEEGRLVFDNFMTRHFCNEQCSFFRQNSLFYIQPSRAIQTGAMFNLSNGYVLDGFFGQNNQEGHWTAIFKKEFDRVSIADQKEVVNGHGCLVLKADLSCGDYTLWLDAEAPYALRKAHILFGPNDRVWGKPLKESSMRIMCYGTEVRRHYRTMEVILDNVKTEAIGGKSIPIEGVYTQHWIFDDDRRMDSQYKICRSAVAFNPDFKALKAFEMNVPEKTVFMEFLDNGNYTKYLWSQGKMIPEGK